MGSFYPPYVGGIETHMAQLAGALLDAGEAVSVSCLESSPRLDSSKHGTSDRINVRRVGAHRWGETVLWPSRLIAASSADVIHFHGFSRPLLLRTLWDCPRVPTIITPHGGLSGIVTDPIIVRRAIKASFDRTAGRLLLSRAYRVVALTEVEAAYLNSHLGIRWSQIAVIPNALPESQFEFSDAEPGESERLLVLSRLSVEKRIGDLIRALGLVTSPIGCDIAGPDSGDEQRLRQLADRLPLGTIHFGGPIYGQAKVRALRAAKALVLSSSAEGMSVSALEAIAQGTPVIASDSASAGLPESACLKYPQGDVAALARCIESLNRPSVLTALRANAIREAESILRVPEHTKLLLDVYRRAVAEASKAKV